jgi:hypothetical protein
MPFADDFSGSIGNNCSTMLNAGSIILFGQITCPNVEPITRTITATTSGAVAATTLSLQSSVADTFLREGLILYFGTNPVVVATAITIGTTAVPVAVRPLTAVVAANATASTWALQRLLAPTNIPITLTSTKQDSTNLTDNLYSSSVKTRVNSNPQIAAIGNPQDRTLYSTILDAANSDRELFCVILKFGGLTQVGRVMVENFTVDGVQSDFEKPQFTLDFQGKIGIITLPQFLTTAEKTNANNMRSLAGLSLIP